jgi:hypothetical protein
VASDYTQPADYLACDPRAILTCPSCGNLMVADEVTMQWHLKVGNLSTSDLPVRTWTFSHTVARSRGGRVGALECSLCNSDRSDDADWSPADGTPTARQGKLAAYREAHAEAKRFRKALRGWMDGGPLPE